MKDEKTIAKAYNEGYRKGYLDAIKGENSPTDERLGFNRIEVSPKENPFEIELLRDEIGYIKDSLDELEGRIKRLEAVVFYNGKEV